MKSFLKSLLLLAAVASIVSCGSSTSGPSSRKPDRERAAGNRAESLNQLNESYVYCAVPGKECPNNVAKLTMRWLEDGKYRIGFCSGTLVGDDLILTNRHCIPPGFKQNGAACKDAIKIMFPETKTGDEERLDCLNIVQVFEELPDQPDIAVIRIERPASRRDIVPMVGNSLSHGDTLTAYTMNPGSELYGSIRKKTCKVSQDDIYYFKQDSTAGNMVITGGRCNVIGGNSGSSILNSSGEIVGVIHSRLDTSGLRRLLRMSGIETRFMDYAGVIANIACLQDVGQAMPSGCEIYERIRGDLKRYLDQKVIDSNLLGVDEGLISFEVQKDLSVKMEQESAPATGISRFKRLDEVRTAMEELYFGPEETMLESLLTYENDK